MAVSSRTDWRSYLVSLQVIPEDALATVHAASGREASSRGALPLCAMAYDRGLEVLEIGLGAGGNGSLLRHFVQAPTFLRWGPAADGSPATIVIEDRDGECTFVRVFPASALAAQPATPAASSER